MSFNRRFEKMRPRCHAAGRFVMAKFNIILLPQRLFILCFLQFAILQDRRTSSSSWDAGHSWEDYCYHTAHFLRSTVPFGIRLPRYSHQLNRSSILILGLRLYLANTFFFFSSNISHHSVSVLVEFPMRISILVLLLRLCSFGFVHLQLFGS